MQEYWATIIYKITNTQTNRVYVGKTFNLQGRWSSHLMDLRLERHQAKLMQFEYNEYGEDSFKIEEIDRTYLYGHGWQLERFWIKQLKSDNVRFGYNSMKSKIIRKPSPRNPEMEAAIRKMLMNEI